MVDFTPIKIKPNTLLYLNKDTVHRFDSNSKFEDKVILFTDSFFCRTDSDTKFLQKSFLFNNLFSVSQIILKKYSNLISNLFRLMTDELQNSKDNLQSEILQNLLHSFLLYSERTQQKNCFATINRSIDLDYVILFKEYLEKDYKSRKQVSYYAKKINISGKRLSQATAAILGRTPKEIIEDRVVLEAKRVLVHTSSTIKEIAYTLGFQESTNFIKHFRRHTRQTPIEFRENYLKS